jgi:kumamolisin
MARLPSGYRRLAGSNLSPSAHGRLVGSWNTSDTIAVSLSLRRWPDGPPIPDHDRWLATPPLERMFLSVEQFAAM